MYELVCDVCRKPCTSDGYRTRCCNSRYAWLQGKRYTTWAAEMRLRILNLAEERKQTRDTMSYYTSKDGLELIDAIRGWNLRYSRGCIVKYIVRMGRKPNEAALEALTKAAHYAELELRSGIYITSEKVQAAFELSDEQAAVVYACVHNERTEDVLRAIRVLGQKVSEQRLAEVDADNEQQLNASLSENSNPPNQHQTPSTPETK